MGIVQAGNYVREDVFSNFIRLVAHTPELQSYTVHKLYLSLRSDVSQEMLTLAGVWILGEYADILLTTTPAGMGSHTAEDGPVNGSNEAGSMRPIQAGEVLDLLELILSSPYSNPTIRQYVLVACTKLSARIDEIDTVPDAGEQKSRIDTLVDRFQHTVELDVQARSVEFHVLLNSLDRNVKIGVLERMPPPELKATVMDTGMSQVRLTGVLRLSLIYSVREARCRQHACRQRLFARLDRRCRRQHDLASDSAKCAVYSGSPCRHLWHQRRPICLCFGPCRIRKQGRRYHELVRRGRRQRRSACSSASPTCANKRLLCI